MGDLHSNIKYWNEQYDWKNKGEEWSKSWGTSEAQWFCSIYPRIHRYLPCQSVLEIAPGYGRWSKFIIPQCKYFTGVDISEKCVNYCKKNYKIKNVNFVQNDGKLLNFINDKSIDLIFSFDSLVHAGKDVMESYIKQCLNKLSKNGIAFIHHSNLLSIQDFKNTDRIENPHWRAVSVSASLIKSYVKKYNGFIMSQELINWGGNELIDCITTFTNNPKLKTGIRLIENYEFMTEANLIRKIQPLYWP